MIFKNSLSASYPVRDLTGRKLGNSADKLRMPKSAAYSAAK